MTDGLPPTHPLSLERAATTYREFVWLWIAATSGYGVGDVVTTIALVRYHPVVAEGNPLLARLLSRFGLGGLVGAKLLVFAVCFGLSFYAVRVWRDRFVYYFAPLVLLLFGVFFTVYNVRLMLG
ncbi:MULTISPECIES: hypothetical protein [Halorussus]|uniref:hypothetical protein n=1 Tax=Halorussus TaxID=1070314 RepID=UPI000E20ECF3|nr:MULTISPECIES: hypothetical protein [Halorussus]NHN61152.1 hypothetical protein [Halorussus sp. JP-T4]